MDAGWRTPPGVSGWHRGKPGRGGPARPGPGAPRPLRDCPPLWASPPQPPQRRQPRGAGSPAAARPRPPAGSPAALSILGNSLISLGSGGGFPLLIWRFRPRAGGAGSPRAGARLPPGRAPAPGARERAEAPALGSALLLPGRVWGAPGTAAVPRAEPPFAPGPCTQLRYPRPSLRGGWRSAAPHARQPRCGGVF